ncbi:hypothetical protein [Yoonia sp.]|uniref:hypothetical protein n=1 Tax=Yoonia sp. TaxID=2212373 RepID=UPI003918F660
MTGVGGNDSQTVVQVADAVLAADRITLTASDDATIVGAGGAVAINLDKAGAAGVGLGVSVNVVNRAVGATVTGTSRLTADDVAISAAMRAALYGFAVSAGVGKTGLTGSVTVNTVSTAARAGIFGTADDRITVNTNKLSITADEDAVIWSLAGAIAGGFKTAAGGALTINVITAETEAGLVFADVQQREGMPALEPDPAAPGGDDDEETPPFQIVSTLDAVTVTATSRSRIGTLAAAGAGGQDNAIGLGMSGNAILAGTVARIDDSRINYAASVDLLAHSDRAIRSLGGAAAFAGRNAVGAAVTANVIDRNTTLASLDRSEIITLQGDITARANATSLIESVAVALGASGKVAVSGSVTVNITTGETMVRAKDAQLVSAGGIVLNAQDKSDIRSLAGGAAFGGTIGIGAAIAANVLAHDTAVIVTRGGLVAQDGDIDLTARNDARIDTLSVGVGATPGNTALAGSVVVAYIGNSARVSANDVALDAGAGRIDVAALKTSQIRALAGAAALSGGGGAVGAAVTVAVIHDTVSAELATNRAVRGGALAITATNQASIDAIAASAGASGDTAVAGSFVFAMIGKAPQGRAETPEMEGLSEGEKDPIADAQTRTGEERDNAFNLVGSETGLLRDRLAQERPSDAAATPSFALDQADLTYAGLTVRGAGTLDVGAIAVNAQELAVGGTAVDAENATAIRDRANLRSLAGAFGVGGTGGVGAAFTVNLLFGETIAEVNLPSGANTALAGDLSVTAVQDGVIQTAAASAGVGGTAGIAGSVTVNVMNRALRAGVYGDNGIATLSADGGEVNVRAIQTGLIQSLAGAVGAAGDVGIGVAVGVNVMADSATSEMVRVRANTTVALPQPDPDAEQDDIAPDAEPVDLTPGNVAVTARQDLAIYGLAVSVGAAGTVGISGSFAVNVNQARMTARMYQSDIRANQVDLRATGDAQIFSLAGAIAGSGTVAVGLGAAINVSSMNVLTDFDASRIVANGRVRVEAVSATSLSGNAIGGAASGTVSVTGTVVTNVATNNIAVQVRNTTGLDVDFDGTLADADLPDDAGTGTLGADILTDGTVLVRAEGTNTISLLGGAKTTDGVDADGNPTTTGATETNDGGVPSVNVSIAVGGSAGIGGSVSVNRTSNDVLVALAGGSRITGLGNSTATSAALGTIRGVAVEANAGTSIKVLTANVGAGLYAGVSGVFGFNIAEDSARVLIGDGNFAGSGAINAQRLNEDGDIIIPNAGQDSYLSARVRNDLSQFNLAVGIGAGGVGAASGTTLVTSLAEVVVDRGQVAAADQVKISALTDTSVMSIAAGAAGGAVGVGGSVGVNILSSQAIVTLRGANIGAGRLATGDGALIEGGSVAINADVISRTIAATGAIAVGAAAAAAAIQVNKFDSVARISVLDAGVGDNIDQTRIDAGGDISLDARSTLDNVAAAVGGAISSGFALAASININLVQAETAVVIDPNQRINAGRDLRLSAREDVDLRNASGAVAIDLGGGAGVGAAFDLAIFSSKTNVTVGNNSVLLAGRDMKVNATANRRLASTVIVGAVGGTVGLSVGLSVVQMGKAVVLGDSANEQKAQTARAGLLAEVQRDLDGDQTTADQDPELSAEDRQLSESNSIEALTARGGGSGVRSDIVAARQNVNVTGQAAVPDDIGVSIDADSTLRAGRDLSATATGNVSVSQIGGSLGAGGVGATAGVLVGNVGLTSSVDIGARALLAADRDIRLQTQTRPLDAESLRMRSYSLALGAVAIGAGIAVGQTSSESKITIAEGARLVGNTTDAARNVTLSATRSDVIDAQVLNVAGGLAGIGLVVVTASNTGRAAITMAGTSAAMVDIRAANITASLRDTTRTQARGIGAAGGIFAAGNATVVIATNRGQVDLRLDHAGLQAAGNISLQSISEAEASARADGVVVSGGVSIGASVAEATTETEMTTSVTNGGIVGNNIDIQTLLRAASGRNNAAATAFSAAGGVIAGNGAQARAFLDYTIATTYSGLFFAVDRLSVAANSSGGRGAATASGVTGGLIAVGVVLAEVGSSSARTSSVTTDIKSGDFFAAEMSLRNVSGAGFALTTTAGSGGAVAGSASVGTSRVAAKSLTDIGTAGAVSLVATGKLDMATGHDGTLRSEMNNINATLVGVSGVSQQTSYVTAADMRLRGNVALRAGELDLRTNQSVQRARASGNNGFNIRSGSGGALDAVAIRSVVTLDARTNTTIDDGARLTQTMVNRLNEPEEFRIGASSNLDLTDRVLLDSGGAIALPRGESEIRVSRDDTAVNIGNSRILAEGVLLVSSGSNIGILAEVDANTYGLAGAASGATKAIYNGNNLINIASGAMIEGMRDIELRAGQIARQTQVVNVRAETRLFNKTAIPIPTDPVADALANTTSRVTIGAGASVEAVQDIYINAIGGTRDVTGYGRGKDLWREVAAAIANAIGGIFGAAPVALDIKSGTSTDNRDNGIIVNGYVRAGSRNSQRLLLNQQNEIDTAYDGYEAWEYENIGWRVIENFGVLGDLQQRVDELNAFIAGWGSRTDESSRTAVAAWTAERDRLLVQVNATAGQRVTLIDVDAIRATGGSIFMRADYVHGSETGTLRAPGEAIIDILVTSAAFVRVDRLTIPARSGGRVTLNDVDVNSAAEIRDLTARGSAAEHSYALIAGLAEEGPLVRVRSTGLAEFNTEGPAGTIILNGDIENLRGTVEVTTQEGDIDVRADVAALTIKMEATNGNFIQGYTPGITNVGGTPAAQAVARAEGQLVVTLEGQYGLFFDSVQRQNENWVRNAAAGQVFTEYRPLPAIKNDGGIRAGKNVFISADMLNINGLIQAGRGAYSVVIDETIDGDLWNEIVERYGANGTGRVLIHNPAKGDDGDVVRSAFIDSDVPVYWNYDDNRIEVARMIVQGGQVDLVGNILSTGNGRIEALDGFGEITLDSNTKLAIALTRIDTGGSGSGVEGVVRITDTSKNVAADRFLTTEYRRLDGQVTIYNNLTEREVFLFDDESIKNASDGERPTRRVPSNLVATLGAGSRSATYDPTQGRDLILLTGEKIVTTYNMLEKELVVIGFRGVRRRVETVSTVRSVERTQLGPAPTFGSLPYLGASLEGQTYDYAFVGRQVQNSFAPNTPKREVHNSVRWWKLGSGWIHRAYERVQTTEQLYEHRLNASKTIDIAFGGSDVGALNLRTAGDLIFSDTVINAYGQSVVASTGGSVRTESNEVALNTANLSITAGGGSITGNGDAFNVNQFANTTLTLTARDNIFVRETGGNMNLVSATSTAPSSGGASSASSGNIHLIARGDLVHLPGAGLVQGANIRLESITGAIGAENAPVRTDLIGGRLNADAARDIAIREVTGDLGVDTIRSRGGSVYLHALDGSITDRNNIEDRDIRTEAELTQLYGEGLGLFGDGLEARAAEQLAALRAQRERMFDDYWIARQESGGTAVDFTLDSQTRQVLEQSSTADMVDAYVASRQALYAEWNARATRDDADALIGLTDEFAGIFDGAGWTNDQLTQTLSAGLVRRTGDTTARVENPNIIANNNIVLRASGSVGELTPDYIINPGATLTAADLLVLGAADRLDLFDEDGNLRLDSDGNIRVVQREDVNFAFAGFDDAGRPIGSLTVVANGREIFVGAETAAAIRQVDGTGDVQILINGAMTDASGDDAPAVRGSILVLESGNQHSIGTQDKPLSIEILPGGSLNARSGQNIFVTAPFGDLPIEALFAGLTASVTAKGAIIDNVGSALPRIVARDIALDAGSIGEDDNMLGIELTDEEDGRITLTTRTGAIYLDVVSEFSLARAELAFGGRIEARKGVTLYGNDTLTFGLLSTLRLETQTGILRAGTTGRNITGGTLDLFSGGGTGSGDLDRLTTALVQLSFTGWGDGPTALWLEEEDSIRIAFVDQTTDAASQTDINASGDISLGQATSQSRTRLAAGGSITDGTIIAAETTLEAGQDIGNLSRIEVETALFRARTTDGDATILLRDRAVDIDHVTIGGAGQLDLRSTDAAVRLLAAGDALNFGTGLSDGLGIMTAGGDMRLDLTSLLARADVASNGGDITVGLVGDLVQNSASGILSGSGAISATIGGALSQAQNARIVTTSGDITLKVTAALTQADASSIISNSGTILAAIGGDLTQRDGSQTATVSGDITLTIGGALAQSQASRIGSETGAISLDVGGDMAQAGASSVTTDSGDIAISVAQDLRQSADSYIASGTATLAIDVGGDFDLALIRTTNASDDALRLNVDGTLRKVAGTGLNIDAANTGGLSVLRLGALAPVGPVGLETDIDRLDIIVTDGDLHINDRGRMTVEQALAETGNVDIFVEDEMVVRNARSLRSGQSHVVLSALGDIRSDNATLQGDIVSLFSFGGEITGETQDYFQGDVMDGNDLRLLSDTDIRYREMSGDLLSQFVLAGNGGQTGDLLIDVVDGSFTTGLLGAVGTITLRAADVKVALIGRATIDIADETNLALVRPGFYGTATAQAPRVLDITAYRSGGRIDLGLANIRQTASLYADNIAGRLYDIDPASDLAVNMTNPDGGFVSQVYLRVIGDGEGYAFADPVMPFSVGSADALYNDMFDLVANRLFASTGTLLLQDSMIGTGEVIHAGPFFVGTNNRIDGDVYFRQRTFDLYAHTNFRFLDTEADAQVFATDEGKIGFTIRDQLILTTQDVLVLNRKLAGVSLDGGQGYTPDVGVETEILGGSFIRGTARGGVLDSVAGALEILLAEEEEEEELIEGEETEGDDAPDPAAMDTALIEHLRASL